MTSGSSIRTVLGAIREARVQALLMGGQACILYGAAEFSRDTDIAIVADADNLARLADALRMLRATVTAIPPFTSEVLDRGHAVHFRCAAADNTRLDVMARMRNVAPFAEIWERRTTSRLADVGDIEVLGLADLVACKKTRRSRDWPMVQRLVDVHFAGFAHEPTDERLRFWLRELRTPALLLDAVALAPALSREVAAERPSVRAAFRRGELSLSWP